MARRPRRRPAKVRNTLLKSSYASRFFSAFGQATTRARFSCGKAINAEISPHAFHMLSWVARLICSPVPCPPAPPKKTESERPRGSQAKLPSWRNPVMSGIVPITTKPLFPSIRSGIRLSYAVPDEAPTGTVLLSTELRRNARLKNAQRP